MLSTPARDVLSAIKTQLEIEPQWSVARPDGFEWWPGRLAQRIWVEDGDSPGIHIESDFLREVPETDRTLSLVAIGNQFVTFSALTFGHRTLRLHASLSLTEENGPSVARFASLVASMQAADADAKAATTTASSSPLSSRRCCSSGASSSLSSTTHRIVPFGPERSSVRVSNERESC